MKADYVIRQGEQLSLSLIATGDVSMVDSVEAHLKKAGPNGSVPPNSAPVEAVFIVQPTADADAIGWDLFLDEADTSNLAPGFYVTNAKLNLSSGGPLKTDVISIEVQASPT